MAEMMFALAALFCSLVGSNEVVEKSVTQTERLFREGDENGFCDTNRRGDLIRSGRIVRGREVFDKIPTWDRCPAMD